MKKSEVGSILAAIVIVFFILAGLFLDVDPQYLTMLIFMLGSIAIYFLLLSLSMAKITKREGSEVDFNSLFDKGSGYIIFEDGSPMVKQLTLDGPKLSFSRYQNRDEMTKTQWALAISALVSPAIGWIIFKSIAVYRLGDDSFLEVFDWITIILYIALIFLLIIAIPSIQIEKKKIKNYAEVLIHKENISKITIEIRISDRALVKDTPNNTLIFEIDKEHLDIIDVSSIDQELRKNNPKSKYNYLVKLSGPLVRYPLSLKVNLEDPRVRIINFPEIKSATDLKSALFVSTTDYKKALNMHSKVLEWMKH
ncbi:MAG: hypothetical protein INQ03_25945 [Candidatus Heimdallarchaeota archaeon]|nr:hypothetical protein [Candidatus Heimdallarchaeota archaeon]